MNERRIKATGYGCEKPIPKTLPIEKPKDLPQEVVSWLDSTEGGSKKLPQSSQKSVVKKEMTESSEKCSVESEQELKSFSQLGE